jgi:hypothetical protein
MDLNKSHLQILQHSLGTNPDGSGTQYRNHFCPGGKDVQLCEELEQAGLMRHRYVFGDICYHVNDDGKKYVADNSSKDAE